MKVNNVDEAVNVLVKNNQENINKVEGNVDGQGNINIQFIENFSDDQALAFFFL